MSFTLYMLLGIFSYCVALLLNKHKLKLVTKTTFYSSWNDYRTVEPPAVVAFVLLSILSIFAWPILLIVLVILVYWPQIRNKWKSIFNSIFP